MFDETALNEVVAAKPEEGQNDHTSDDLLTAPSTPSRPGWMASPITSGKIGSPERTPQLGTPTRTQEGATSTVGVQERRRDADVTWAMAELQEAKKMLRKANIDKIETQKKCERDKKDLTEKIYHWWKLTSKEANIKYECVQADKRSVEIELEESRAQLESLQNAMITTEEALLRAELSFATEIAEYEVAAQSLDKQFSDTRRKLRLVQGQRTHLRLQLRRRRVISRVCFGFAIVYTIFTDMFVPGLYVGHHTYYDIHYYDAFARNRIKRGMIDDILPDVDEDISSHLNATKCIGSGGNYGDNKAKDTQYESLPVVTELQKFESKNQELKELEYTRLEHKSNNSGRLRSQIDNYEGKLQSSKEEIVHLTEKVALYEVQLAELNAQLEAANLQLASTSDKNEKYKEEVIELRSQLEVATEVAKNAEKRMNEKRSIELESTFVEVRASKEEIARYKGVVAEIHKKVNITSGLVTRLLRSLEANIGKIRQEEQKQKKAKAKRSKPKGSTLGRIKMSWKEW